MPLAPGTLLGHYEVTALIGKGGMGEVYRGRDTRLGRDVAIKVSADRFSERFEREARAIAALNHPNICTLYDVGPNYLVMEYIEGEAPKGPMPVDEALRVATQIAAALREAHEKRITHRDLKPANIKVKADGLVKVLDFGLAKIGPAPAALSEDSPTLTMGGTVAGTILGTAAYMSPEQARGKDVDKRTDIWAFGVVLYELVTGQRPFKGEDLGETLASVVKEPVDLAPVPARVRRLIERCLQKDATKRLQDIGDFDLLLVEEVAPAPVMVEAPAHRSVWPWAAAVFAAALAGVGWVHFRETQPEPEMVRFEIHPPDNTTLTNVFAISPDGKTLAFSATGADGRRQIWLRSMDSPEARPLNGTEGVGQPIFWSPDSRSLAFSGVPPLAKLMRIDIAGGSAQALCDAPAGPPIGTWTKDGRILYRGADGLYQVPARGGNCTLVAALDSKRNQRQATFPRMLPDGKHFLYQRTFAKSEDSGVFIGSLDAKPAEQSNQRLLAGAGGTVYVPSTKAGLPGHLLFSRNGTAFAQEFDEKTLALLGEAVPIADEFVTGTVSETGIMVYRTGQATTGREMRWVDRNGKRGGTVDHAGPLTSLAISHDGKRVAFARDTNGNTDLWIHEIASGTTSKFTFDPGDENLAFWSPDDSRIAFNTGKGILQKLTNMTAEAQLIFKQPDRPTAPGPWSRSGGFLLYQWQPAPSTSDIGVLALTPEGAEAKPLLTSQFAESHARFSPDDRYLAYTSTDTGIGEVYVRPFSQDGTLGAPQMISQGGGFAPLWRADGKELYYMRADGQAMAVPVSTVPVFKRGTAEPMFLAATGAAATNIPRWDIAPDGRFLLNVPVMDSKPTPLSVVLNWEQLLKKR